MADTADVLFEQQDSLGILTFNRPQRLNALSGDIVSASLEIIERISASRSVRALIITGAGRGFCSGADLGADRALEGTAGKLGEGMRNGINQLILAIWNSPFPVVTAVNGSAAGGQDELVASNDLKEGIAAFREKRDAQYTGT